MPSDTSVGAFSSLNKKGVFITEMFRGKGVLNIQIMCEGGMLTPWVPGG